MHQNDNEMVNDIINFDISELSIYINNRLIGSDPFFSIANTHDERPEYLIHTLIDRNRKNTDFLNNLEKAIFSLFEPIKNDIINFKEFDENFFSSLLTLIEKGRFKLFEEALHFLASNIEFLKDTESIYCEDLYEQTLQTLTVLQSTFPAYRAIWLGILENSNLNKYFKIAFKGMRFLSLSLGIEAFKIIAPSLSQKKDKRTLSNSFSSLMAQYCKEDDIHHNSKIIDKLIQECLNCNDETRRFIYNCLIEFPFVKDNFVQNIHHLIPLIVTPFCYEDENTDYREIIKATMGEDFEIDKTTVKESVSFYFTNEQSRKNLASEIGIRFPA